MHASHPWDRSGAPESSWTDEGDEKLRSFSEACKCNLSVARRVDRSIGRRCHKSGGARFLFVSCRPPKEPDRHSFAIERTLFEETGPQPVDRPAQYSRACAELHATLGKQT